MSKELEDRVARLERAYGATGDIHAFDSAGQAEAHKKKLEEDSAAEVEAARAAQRKLDAERAQAELDQAKADADGATANLRAKQEAAKSAAGSGA